MKPTAVPLALAVCMTLAGCSDDDSATIDETTDEPRVGYEIIHARSPSEIVAWAATQEMAQAQFDAIELPGGWFKNQPRESCVDGGRFFKSPGASADGELTQEDLYGYPWMHVATITKANEPLDPDGLLKGNTITKHHEVTFDAGRTIVVLVSPDGVSYARITRDFNRTTDTPTIPGSWRLVEHVTADELVVRLPDEILNIRADNEDSFQGPVVELEGL